MIILKVRFWACRTGGEGVMEERVWGLPLVGKMMATICIRKNCLNAEVHATRKYN